MSTSSPTSQPLPMGVGITEPPPLSPCFPKLPNCAVLTHHCLPSSSLTWKQINHALEWKERKNSQNQCSKQRPGASHLNEWILCKQKAVRDTLCIPSPGEVLYWSAQAHPAQPLPHMVAPLCIIYGPKSNAASSLKEYGLEKIGGRRQTCALTLIAPRWLPGLLWNILIWNFCLGTLSSLILKAPNLWSNPRPLSGQPQSLWNWFLGVKEIPDWKNILGKRDLEAILVPS